MYHVIRYIVAETSYLGTLLMPIPCNFPIYRIYRKRRPVHYRDDVLFH